MQFDEFGLIVQDRPSLDGGDTCNRMGHFFELKWVWNMKLQRPTGNFYPPIELPLGFNGAMMVLQGGDGRFRRHPYQKPWDNPKNLTRDQLKPIHVAMALHGTIFHLEREFWKMVKRFGFYPNIERDYPGTRKSLLPQFYKKGQRIDDGRIAEKDQWLWEPNYADLCAPNDWAVFIRGFGLRILWPLLLFTDLFDLLGVLSHCFVYAKDPTNCDDMNLISSLILAKAKMPTPISKLARRLYFKYRPKNNGNFNGFIPSLNSGLKSWGGESCAVMGAIAWYFAPPNIRGSYDSPVWIEMYRPVIGWLKEG